MKQSKIPEGLWLPLITPFQDGAIDEASLKRLLFYYTSKNISGLILAATTGEGQLLSSPELEQLVHVCADELAKLNASQKLYLGLSGSDLIKVIDEINRTSNWPIDGYLISGPNYLRPSQTGLVTYFQKVAGSTEKPIILYNIPYRTGVNIENDTMLELAEVANIVGVKDCCGNVQQSYDLIRRAPSDFGVLTGEDPFFYNAMVHGAAGAILTGAHVLVDEHLKIMDDIANANQASALDRWNGVVEVPSLLFAEPSPSPLKYWLTRMGLIDSAEVRLPFLPIDRDLEKKISTCAKALPVL